MQRLSFDPIARYQQHLQKTFVTYSAVQCPQVTKIILKKVFPKTANITLVTIKNTESFFLEYNRHFPCKQ